MTIRNISTKRLDKIKELIKVGLANEEITISKLSQALNIKNQYVEEYLQIIKYISENPVMVKIEHKDRFTFVSISDKK